MDFRSLGLVIAASVVLAGCGSSGPTLTPLEVVQKVESANFPCENAQVKELPEQQVTLIKCDSLSSEFGFLQINVFANADVMTSTIERGCASESASLEASPSQEVSAPQGSNSSATSTADRDASITALVTTDKAGVPGVTVQVSGADGFSDTGVTDADGRVTLPVPSNGKYTVTLDENTIPSGQSAKDGPARTVNVITGDKKVLFPIGESVESSPSDDVRPPPELLFGENWFAFSSTNVPSLADLQKVLGGEIRVGGYC